MAWLPVALLGMGIWSVAAVVDRFDRRHVLLLAFAGFLVATLYCGMASDYPHLLGARAFARRVADTVHVMIHGRIVESGPARRVLDDPREEATRSFIGSVMEVG